MAKSKRKIKKSLSFVETFGCSRLHSVSSNLDMKKSIESFNELIQEHQKKIDDYEGPKDYLVSYWEKQIKTFEKNKEKEKDKLKNKS